jgi:hypothetical protein
MKNHHAGFVLGLITVVPGSGASQLVGITGRMTINVAAGGKHSYDFEYTIPKTD